MKIVGKTDKGKVRKTNQDDFAFGELSGGSSFAIVCDGMGGASGGSVASSTAVKVFSNEITLNFKSGLSSNELKSILQNAVNTANAKVYEMAKADKSLLGMGTTIVACLIANDEVIIANAGDSRAYLIDENGATQVTKDHSMVQEMLDVGKLSAEEAKNHPQKNIITRALGVDKTLDIDFYQTSLTSSNAILLCTDGLSNHVEVQTIESILKLPTTEQASEELIRSANEDGGSDNITVVIISK